MFHNYLINFEPLCSQARLVIAPGQKYTQAAWSPQCFIQLCTLCFLLPTEAWLSSSETGLDRLSRARDAAHCRSRPAASSHYLPDTSVWRLFLKADKSSCRWHFSPGRVSFCTQKIKEDFGFGCSICKWLLVLSCPNRLWRVCIMTATFEDSW